MTLAVALLSLTACEIEQKEILYGPDGAILQNPGRMRVEQKAGDVISGRVFTIVDAKGNTVTTIGNNEWVDLEAGTYSLVGYINGELFDLSGTVITLKSMVGGAQLPDNISGGADAFPVIEDQWSVASVGFGPLTRKLRIEAELEGVSPKNVTGMLATLSGLAGGVDLSKGFGAVVKASGNYTAQITATVVNGKLIMEITLLGVDVDVDQLFTIEFTTVDGHTYTVTMSLRDILRNFNFGNSEFPFTVNIKLSVDGKSSLKGTIIDWEDGEHVDIPGE